MSGVVADSQYAAWLAGRVELEPLEESLARRRFGLGALARRGGVLGGFVRGVFMAYRGRNATALVVCDHQPGAATVLFCEAWLRRRRRVVLIELLRGPRPRRAWARSLYGAWSALVRRPALRRAVSVAHVLTREEIGRYSELYGLDASRIAFVPWPWRQFREPHALEPRASAQVGEATVLSSGRAYCDWATLLAAARSREWQLTVLCSTSDAAEVTHLSAGENVVVHTELPLAAHAKLLERASVYVISMREDWVSAGQVRLMHAVQAGVPVVATRCPQLRDYCIDGETVLLVAPGDHLAMAQAVERVLADPELAESLRQGAWRHSARWVRDDYLDSIADLVKRAAKIPSK